MTDDELLRWADRQRLAEPVPPNALDNIKALADRIRELEAERDRWEALCEKAWKNLNTMGFQGLHEAFGDGPTHVIVPVTPTEAMLDAGRMLCDSLTEPWDVWSAMLRAAQPDASD